MYLNASEYIDFSVEENRRKFFDVSGSVVNLGVDGSTPTGSQPEIYLGNDYDTFHQNLGSGGDFTVSGGGLNPIP